MHQPLRTIEATYKAREVEGFFDRHFYRPVGFWIASICAKLGMSPTGVTVLGGISGVVAGHLYYYRDLRLNVAGMVLQVLANAFDNADGQLARLTNRGNRYGRIIDGLADDAVFISIYLHLMFRYLVQGASPLICLLVLTAAISHMIQGAAADYFRNAYLYLTRTRSAADFDSFSALRLAYEGLTWRSDPWHKFLLALYMNFTRQQETLSPCLKELCTAVRHLSTDAIPAWLDHRLRNEAGPAFKWWRLLMPNARMLTLFALLFVGRPIWYFWLDVSALNFLLIYLHVRQERMARSFLHAWPVEEADVITSHVAG